MKHIFKILCIALAVLLLSGCIQQSGPLPQAPTTTTAADTTTTTKTNDTTTTTDETTVATTAVTTTAATTHKPQTVKPTTKTPTTAKPTTKKPTTNAPVVTTTTRGVVTPSDVSTAQQEVFRLVNEERAKVGAAPLAYYSAAQAAADTRAEEIVTHFSHTRPNGETCFTALDALNISYYAAGENIAYGQTTAAWVMNAWMNSAGHRENILNENFNAIVVGCVVKDGVPYWVQLFLGV